MESGFTRDDTSHLELNIETERIQPSPDTHSAPSKIIVYQYQPLATSDSIRIAELLPGGPEDSIQVLLHHRLVSDLSNTSVISYMWGDPSRVYDVSCHGRTVKVTASVILLLQKLRSTEESQLIWLDGICINQDDLTERSHQVTLMKDIYQSANTMFIWIGDETHYTKEAFKVAKDLAQGHDLIKSTKRIEDNGFRQFKTTEDIPELSELGKLPNEPFWEGVIDTLLSRKYFRRLWIVQEVVLSSNPTVVCGRHRIPWETFYKATVCIWYCHFLQVGKQKIDHVILADIKIIGDMKGTEEFRVLPNLLSSFSHKLAYDRRDRIFALLGMLTEGSQHKLLQVDYTKSVERVFQDATEYIITHHQTLGRWIGMNFDLVVRSNYKMPSWVQIFNIYVSRFVVKDYPVFLRALKLGDRRMAVDGDVLTAYGVILDTIEASLPNFLEDTFKTIILDVFGFFFSMESKAGGSDKERLIRAAKKTLGAIHPYEVDRFKNDNAFFGLISKWMLLDLGIDASVVEQNPKLTDLAEVHPKLKEAYPEEIEGGKSIQDVVKEDEALKWMLEQTEVDNDSLYEKGLRYELFDNGLDVGRNFFLGKMGYCGVGPAGKCGAEGKQAAVQTGDVLALLYTSPMPIILRHVEGGIYSVVGSCHVGNLDEIQTPVFKDGKIPEPVQLKIR